MSDDVLSEWVERAEEDFHLAQVALRQRKFPAYNSVCFHAQQCAEKYLKAFLVSRRAEFRKTHDLRELGRLCVEAGMVFGVPTDSLIALNQYAVAVRYPGESATLEEARDAVRAAKEVRKFARHFLGPTTK